MVAQVPGWLLLWSTKKTSTHCTEPLTYLMKSYLLLFTLFISALLVTPAQAQEHTYDPALYQAMQWRNIGPFRGGRSTTVAGVNDDVFTYYMGTTGGGVWKTTDGGDSWKNITDKFFKTGSIRTDHYPF